MPPVRQEHGHVQLGSCSAGANGRGLKISDGQKMCLYWLYFKMSVSSFVPTKHDPGWTSVLIRTRGPLVTPVRDTASECCISLLLNQLNCTLSGILVFSFYLWIPLYWFLVLLNSFSVFGHYISARLQIIWRPYLWLVWSFTQMVSFLEFSISNPVFPPLPPFIFSSAPPEC